MPIGSVTSKLTPEQRARLIAEPEQTQRPTTEEGINISLNLALKVLASDPAALNGPLTTWIPRIMFLLLPAYALLLTIFYWRKRKTFYFVDHLVFSLNIHTFGFVLLLGAAAAAQVPELQEELRLSRETAKVLATQAKETEGELARLRWLEANHIAEATPLSGLSRRRWTA
jgi:hypothetical protein